MENDEFLKYNANSLLLSIKVSSILAAHGVEIEANQEMIKHYEFKEYFNDYDILPIIHKLIYSYGPENKWIINIRRLNNFDSLVKDGENGLEDVANLSGFCKFLTIIYEGKYSKERNTMLKYARRIDWHIDEISILIVF